MKVLVVLDKFKGTLSAPEAAAAIATGWRRARPGDELEVLPMSDGGDGFGEVMGRLLGAETQSVRTEDAAHRPIAAQWWWSAKNETAIVESACVIGLALLSPKKFHPFDLDTSGLAAVLRAAESKGAKRCLMGIGGSATNDGGFGMARGLGWLGYNQHNQKVERWTELNTLTHLVPPTNASLFDEFIVAVDVQNPLLGETGCTRVYGPQKGLGAGDFEFAELCLQRLACVAGEHLGSNVANESGAGAAGGLGFGLRCFTGARLEPGFKVFSRAACLPERLKSAQLVLTGEGRMDEQTFMGKGVGELARMCRQSGVPCVAFAGEMVGAANARSLFSQTYALSPEFTPRDNALAEPAFWLEKLAAKASRHWA